MNSFRTPVRTPTVRSRRHVFCSQISSIFICFLSGSILDCEVC